MAWIKPELFQQVIIRVPQLPLDATLESYWEELKSSISLSSGEFFQQIKDVPAEKLKELPSRVYLTVLKYFNRAKFRAVPYGTFAGVGLAPLVSNGQKGQITISDQQVVHLYLDWSCKDDYPYTFEELEGMDGYLFANSSYYRVQDGLRYIYGDDGSFELAEIPLQPGLQEVLTYCRQPVKISQVYRDLARLRFDQGDLRSTLYDLISQQLLFTSLDPNIIGEDYFQRRAISTDGLRPSYVIAERPYISGGLESRLLHALPRLVRLLQQVAPAPESPQPLKAFIQAFTKRFDQREIPIMEALDPELGVGYALLDQSGSADLVVSELAAGRHQKEQPRNLLRSFLSERLLTGREGSIKAILLEDLKREHTAPPQCPLPNTFSAVMTEADGLLQLEHLGGNSANLLAGRFSLAGDDIYRFCRQVAAAEQEANPEVLFFDIAYMAEGRVDNVNRRLAIYDQQLSILNYDTSAAPLTLDDIMVRVAGGEVLLRSQRLNKRLIPRIASAYNYGRSDLPLFRLLCDLQHQGLQVNLAFDLQKELPDLCHYPRVQFENIIVSPAMWRLRYKDVSDPKMLRHHLEKLGVSACIKTGVADQKLCLDLRQDDDLQLLLQVLHKSGELLVEEAVVPQNSMVRDQSGEPYQAQMLVTLGHKENIFSGAAAPEAYAGKVQAFFPPGSKEWLYFEIYCHPQRADQLLQEKVAPLLEAFTGAIKKWFFIRYNEQGDHIRLRIQFQDPAASQSLTEALSDLIRTEMEEGIVSDLQVKTYRRELERYGYASMEKVEEHFFRDSAYVFNLVGAALDDFSKYRLCLDLARQVQAEGLTGGDDYLELLRTIYQEFSREHRATPASTKQINKLYEDYRQAAPQRLTPALQQRLAAFRESFIDTLKQCPEKRRRQLFTDLFHMHINRLFPEHQRTHEMIIYNFFIKEWQRNKIMEARPMPESQPG